MRIDKFLWTVRLLKTRSLATKACGSEHVKLNDSFVKASKLIGLGDKFAIRQIPIWRSFKVINIPKSRVGAKLVKDYIIETTSEDDTQLLQNIQEQNRQNRFQGIKGRPTKKQRRDMDKMND